jgi:MtN3 and saliva related transmembrane protein
VSASSLELQIGLIAGTLTTLSFVPQVIRSWRRRSVADLSMTMLLAFAAGVSLWIVYGVLTRAIPVIVSNSVTLVLALALIAMKWTFERPIRQWEMSASAESVDRTPDRASDQI